MSVTKSNMADKIVRVCIRVGIGGLFVINASGEPGGGALGYFLGGYVPPETPNWHPVLKKISPKIDTPF